MPKINLDINLWLQDRLEKFVRSFVEKTISEQLCEEYGQGYCSVDIDSIEVDYFLISWVYTDSSYHNRIVGNGSIDIRESIKAYLGIENSLSYDPAFIQVQY